MIGLKTVVNEFVAYQRMGEMKRDGLLSVIIFLLTSRFIPREYPSQDKKIVSIQR